MATITTKTLIRKIEPHQKFSSSQPPSTGPRMIPRPATAAQAAMARPRSGPVKTLVMMERVAGMINAPPIPIAARAAIRVLAESAKAAAIELSPNNTSPMLSASLRPKRSPRAPIVSSNPANTKM